MFKFNKLFLGVLLILCGCQRIHPGIETGNPVIKASTGLNTEQKSEELIEYSSPIRRPTIVKSSASKIDTTPPVSKPFYSPVSKPNLSQSKTFP